MWRLVGFYLSSVYINSVGASICALRAKRLLCKPFAPLPDIGHELFPRIPHYTPDFFLWVELTLTMLFGRDYLSSEQWVFAIVTHGCLLLLRGMTVSLTTYPTCMPDTDSPSWHQNRRLWRLYDLCFHKTHDLMFSGHTQLFLLCSYLWEVFVVAEVASVVLARWIIRICASLGTISLIFSRQHYSSDVVVSVFITVFLLHSSIPQLLMKVLY